ncbi:MAG TPA: triose-phosphate isomerase [Candidatus Kapabacteria bacterium]|nr:triose-phosphate isomerase [Candidatus Kapabacteria bacterium]HPO62632.1 triose-phosphate isomerase [Candidatus Kapabacteria bacterium]
MKKFLIAGNWKMNTTPKEAKELSLFIKNSIEQIENTVDILVCPPFTNITAAAEVLEGSMIKLGAQNCYFAEKGAFTGEISLQMLKALNCSYVIIGHSERRKIFKESNELINKKIIACLSTGIIPIFCIGETLEERQSGNTFNVLKEQMSIGLKDISKEQTKNIVIAYEPVWAIGTGIAATPEQIQETHHQIKEFLNELYNDTMENLILYGGSVDDKNAKSILELDDVNGGLIGGASLKGEVFLEIIKIANDIQQPK